VRPMLTSTVSARTEIMYDWRSAHLYTLGKILRVCIVRHMHDERVPAHINVRMFAALGQMHTFKPLCVCRPT
jgi:hypothetical protein